MKFAKKIRKVPGFEHLKSNTDSIEVTTFLDDIESKEQESRCLRDKQTERLHKRIIEVASSRNIEDPAEQSAEPLPAMHAYRLRRQFVRRVQNIHSLPSPLRAASSPLPPPELNVTPSTAPQLAVAPPVEKAQPVLSLYKADLDYLVAKLATSPFMQTYVRAQFYDRALSVPLLAYSISDRSSECATLDSRSYSSSSSTATSECASTAPSSVSTKSQPPDRTFSACKPAVAQSGPQAWSRVHSDLPAVSLTSNHADTGPTLSFPSLFRSVALTDPNITGQPIRFLAPGSTLGDNVLRMGACTFLNLPYGAGWDCQLRVQGPEKKVLLQIVQSVIDYKTCRRVWLLCCECDVTSQFALTAETDEKAVNLAIRLRTSEALEASTEGNGESVDTWTEVAKEFAEPGSGTVDDGDALSRLQTPAFADLLSLISEIKLLYSNFVVLRVKSYHPSVNGEPPRPKRVNIPWYSSSLFSEINDFKSTLLPENNDKQDVEDLIRRNRWRTWSDRLAETLYPRIWLEKKRFAEEMKWLDGIKRCLLAVPMFEGSNAGGRSERLVDCWVVFVLEEGFECLLD
ncbi:hypothetical protein H2203_001889 [Taxawa tesnikishii (nom. ined.)]|nr:hypothetical protein H2203_001889 [Dothideales sp. JES 119]